VLAASGVVRDRVELGLHVNLTEGAPLSADLARHWPTFPGLPRLIAGAHLGVLPLAALAVELRAQVDAFAASIGRLPAYLDGHQHVHHLPGLRERVVALAASRGPGPSAFAVRSTGRVLGPRYAAKRFLIARTGGIALQRLLDRDRVRHNTALLGVYDFVEADYRRLVRGWLAAAPPAGGLVFCHPHAGPAYPGDPIGAARRREAAYLASEAFAADLAESGVSVGAAWPRSSSAG
jgi:hypothetical protein